MHWFRSITQKKREGWVSLSSETFSLVVFLFWPFLQQAVEHLEVFRTLSTKGYQAFFPGKNRGPGSELGGESRAKSLVLWHFTCQAASSHPPLKFYGFEKEFCLIMPFTTCSEYQDGLNVIVISLFKMDFDLKYQIWSRRCKSAALTKIFTWKTSSSSSSLLRWRKLLSDRWTQKDKSGRTVSSLLWDRVAKILRPASGVGSLLQKNAIFSGGPR